MMTDGNQPSERNRPDDDLSEKLAEFDDALAHSPDVRRGQTPEEMSADPTLSLLESTVLRLEKRWPRSHGPRGRDAAALSSAAPPESDSRLPFGRFLIERELGRGGFGVVLLAYDPELRRHVALKIPRIELFLDEDKQRRFLGEAETAAALDHPNIVPIYEAGTIGPTAYIVSAYCAGPDLSAWLDQTSEPPPLSQAADLVRKLAQAVHAAHQKGVVHRDLEPSNVLLVPKTEDDLDSRRLEAYEPRLTDFGLAKLVEGNIRQTRTSLVIGTPLYMAPELLERRPDRVGPQADVYSLGVILFELASGRPPIERNTYIEIADQIRSSAPPSLRSRRADCPRDPDTICRRCLEKAPELRYKSAADLAHDLRAFVAGEPIRDLGRRPISRLLYWSRRPERIRDAAVFAMCFQGFVAVWLLIMMIMLPQYEIRPPDVIRRTQVEAAAVGVTIHGLMAAVSWLALYGRRWAVAVGLWISALHLLAPLSRVFGRGLYAEVYRGEDFYAFNIFALIFVGFILQFALYVFAYIASRAE